eukprot:6388684-Prymnesium_polylepis.1
MAPWCRASEDLVGIGKANGSWLCSARRVGGGGTLVAGRWELGIWAMGRVARWSLRWCAAGTWHVGVAHSQEMD